MDSEFSRVLIIFWLNPIAENGASQFRTFEAY